MANLSVRNRQRCIMGYEELITQLENIAERSRSIPAQMCGEAAQAIKKITNSLEYEPFKELEALRHRVADQDLEIDRLLRANTPPFIGAPTSYPFAGAAPAPPPITTTFEMKPGEVFWVGPDGQIVSG